MSAKFRRAAKTVFLSSFGGFLVWGLASGVYSAQPAGENAANSEHASGAAQAEINQPFEHLSERFRKEKDSPALFFKNSKGEEIPIINESGEVLYRRPEDKPVDQMTEEDLYKTLSPAEKSILASGPKSAADWIGAAVKIARLGRGKRLAVVLLEKSGDAEGTPAEFAALIDNVGADKLLKFGSDGDLGPKAAEALRRAFGEARKHWETPDVVRDAFSRTLVGDEADRVQAMLDVRKGGVTAFGILLGELDSDDTSRSKQAARLLGLLDDRAKEGLLVELAHVPSEKLVRLAGVFAEIRKLPDLSPLLIRYYDDSVSADAKEALGEAIRRQNGSIPDRAAAAETAARLGTRCFERKTPRGDSVDGERPCWRWNAETQSVEPSRMADNRIDRLRAAYLLTAAHRLDPAHTEITAKAAVALGERIVYDGGLDNPPDLEAFKREMGECSTDELTAALDFALRSGRGKGGVIAALLLGETGDASLCVNDKKESVLVRAATAPDRRLRFAALTAIDKLNPPTSYPGSASVVNALLHFASSSGRSVALVGASKLENGSLIGNCFSEGSVRIVPATSGGILIRLSQENADVEYVVAVSSLREPDPRTVCQTLAADYRTSDILIYVGFENETYLEQAEYYAGSEPNAVALPLPSDRETGRWALEELYKKANPEQVPAGRRLEQAREAVKMLTRRLGRRQTFCEPATLDRIAVDFLRRPEIRVEALDFAQIAGGAAVQNELADQVGDQRIRPEARENILAALRRHVENFGVQLRGPEIRRYYDEYNASEALPAEEQKILSRRLDVLEGKTAPEAESKHAE